MAVIFSHGSSIELLRGVPPQPKIAKRLESELEIEKCSTVLRPTSGSCSYQGGSCVSAPFHVLVGDAVRRSRSDLVRTHSLSTPLMPKDVLMELGEGQYFCGSELTFIQIAANHSLCATVVLGYELCGCYSHFPRMDSKWKQSNSTASPSAKGSSSPFSAS